MKHVVINSVNDDPERDTNSRVVIDAFESDSIYLECFDDSGPMPEKDALVKLTPEMARAIAKELVEAADYADSLYN